MAAQDWQEYKTPEGRVYFYNVQTRQSSWTKPDELLTPKERALAKIVWREYETQDGRKYWNNRETGESVWHMPQEYKSALEEAEAETEAANGEEEPKQEEPKVNRKVSEDPEEEWNSSTAFVQILRARGVDHTWTWERVVRELITDEDWNVLPEAAARRAAFDQFVEKAVREAEVAAKETLERRKNEFLKVLKSKGDVKPYSRWRTVLPLVKDTDAYRDFEEDAESTFRDYVAGLKSAEEQQQAKLRQEGLAVMREYFQSQVGSTFDVFTKWQDVKERIKHDEFLKSQSKVVQSLNMLDILTVFEECMKDVEDRFLEERKAAKQQVRTSERKNRERYIDLLDQLCEEGKITADSGWTQVYPFLKDDERYLDLVGQPGSSPLELFWDLVEKLNKAIRIKRDILLDILEERKFQFTHKTTYDQFEAALAGDPRASEIDESVHKSLFERQHARAVRKLEEDKHQEERRLRRKIDALRSVIRHLDPPLTGKSTWEETKPRIEDTPEYLALEDSDRVLAFEKQLARAKEREREHDYEDGEVREKSERKHSRD